MQITFKDILSEKNTPGSLVDSRAFIAELALKIDANTTNAHPLC